MSTTAKSANALTPIIVGLVVVFCFTIAACVAIFVAAPEGANTGSLITILISAMANVVGVLALFVKVSGTDAKVDQVARDTNALTNGLLDAKLRASHADVTPIDRLDPEYVATQLEVDRRVRAEVHLDGTTPSSSPTPTL